MAALGFLALLALSATAAGHKMEPHRLKLFNTAGAAIQLDAGAEVTVNTTYVPPEGGWVEVSFACGGSTCPSSDLLAAYNVGDNVSTTAPLQYFPVPSSYAKRGAASLAARIWHNRAPWQFALVRGGLNSPTVVALSEPVTTVLQAPTGVRLAVTGQPDSVRISWTSSNNASLVPSVTYWPTAGGGSGPFTTVQANTTHLQRGDFCGGDATGVGYRDAGFFHSAVLTGLTPGTSYTYTVGDLSPGNASHGGPFTFTQLPDGRDQASAFPFGIAAVGDMGQNTIDGSLERYNFDPAPNTTRLMAAEIAAGRVHTVLHCGDVSYARGFASEWDVFADNLRGVTPYVTYNVDLGNHERDFPGSVGPGENSWGNGTDSEGECGVATVARFPMPSPGGSSNTSALYWSAATGPVLQVHFSTELDFSEGSDAWQFIRSTLQAVDRSATPWVIVAFHRPMYISSTNDGPGGSGQNVATLLRQHVEPLLLDAGGSHVDLVLQGHHHSYQRTTAVYNQTVVTRSTGPNNVYDHPGAPVHMVIGTGGAGYSTNIEPRQPEWFELVQFVHGFARITLHNASALQWQFINDVDGSVFDEAWILK